VKETILLFSFLLMLSCAVAYTSSMHPVLREMDRGATTEAMSTFRDVFPDSTGKDRLLYLMELGNLARYAGQENLAQTLLLRADRLSDNLRGVQLGQEAQAMITSDLALEFRGADYEKVFINYCLAASFARAGNFESAIVEARSVNEKLKEINISHQENPNRYNDDAFVRYFMGVLYEIDGYDDDALISYRLALATYDSVYSSDYSLDAPVQLHEDLMRLAHYNGFESLYSEYQTRWPDLDWSSSGPTAEMGEVVVILELGNIASRKASDFTVYSDDRVYSIALPVIPKSRRRIVSGRFTIAGRSVNSFLVEDLNGIARSNLEDQAGRNIIRAAARFAIKAGVAELGESVTEQLTDNENISSGVGLVLSIFGAATEQADLRAWLTLPAQIQMVRVQVPPGNWPLSYTLGGETLTGGNIQVEAGEISLVFLRGNI